MQNDNRSIPFGWIDQLQEWWQKQPFVNRFYIGGFSILGLMVIYIFSTIKEPGPHIWTRILFWLGIGGLLIGIVVEGVNTAKQILATTWGKWTLGIIGAFIWSLCVLTARHDINAIAHVSPEHFGTAINWLAAIAAPFVFAALMVFVLFPLSIFMQWLPAESKVLQLGRSFGLAAIAILMSVVLSGYSLYGKAVRDLQTTVLVSFDYYGQSSCLNVRQDERVAFLGRDVISVAKFVDDGWQFETRICRLTEPNKQQLFGSNDVPR